MPLNDSVPKGGDHMKALKIAGAVVGILTLMFVGYTFIQILDKDYSV